MCSHTLWQFNKEKSSTWYMSKFKDSFREVFLFFSPSNQRFYFSIILSIYRGKRDAFSFIEKKNFLKILQKRCSQFIDSGYCDEHFCCEVEADAFGQRRRTVKHFKTSPFYCVNLILSSRKVYQKLILVKKKKKKKMNECKWSLLCKALSKKSPRFHYKSRKFNYRISTGRKFWPLPLNCGSFFIFDILLARVS